jgi:hypothetical protein
MPTWHDGAMALFRRKRDTDFKAMSKERRTVEDEQPWFAVEDDGPELDVETGIGSNLRRDDPTARGTD